LEVWRAIGVRYKLDLFCDWDMNESNEGIDLHTRDLLKTMAADKVALVPVWEEVPHLFSEQYRAALAWAEEVSLVSETHASDPAYAAVSAAFEPKDLVDLTIAIAAMNAFNRLGAPFRLPVKAQP
jgi:alkylhydroperoxidase family enzyme